MSELIIYEQNRIEISNTKQEDLVISLRDILLNCYQIKGHVADASVAILACQLAEFIREKYSKYTINELSNIIKNGYAFNGDDFVHVSVSNCLSIIKRYDDSIYNREKLSEARKNSDDKVEGSPMSREHDFKVKCYKIFKNAKFSYKSGKVNDYNINFVYHLAYQHVLDEIDKNINQTKKIRREIWEDVKKYISECKSKEIQNPKVHDTFMKLIFECKSESELAENALKGRLFNLWAIEHFNENK